MNRRNYGLGMCRETMFVETIGRQKMPRELDAKPGESEAVGYIAVRQLPARIIFIPGFRLMWESFKNKEDVKAPQSSSVVLNA